MKMMKMFFTFMLIFSIAGCNSDSNESDNGDNPNNTEEQIMDGTIVNVVDNKVLLDSKQHGLIYLKKNDLTFASGVSDMINIGNYMKVEFDGSLLESYPLQTSADSLKVLENKTQEFPKGLSGYFKQDDKITTFWIEDKDAFIYKREFDFCAQALEKVYEDEDGTYYLPCISSTNYAVYANGEFMSLIDAFKDGVIHPVDAKEYINVQSDSEAVSK